MYQVKKRNGDLEMFELSKIKSAITRTFEACGRNYQDSIVETLAIKSVANAEKKIKDDVLSVEDIQDSVESILMGYGYEDVSKAYILYRKQHEKARNAKNSVLDYKKTMDGYLKASDWRVKENSTVTYSLGGLILGNSGAMTANYWLSEIYDDEIANAHRNCDFHIHDLSMLSAYCFTGDTKVAVIKQEYEKECIDSHLNKYGEILDYREFVSFEELIKSGRTSPYIIAHTGNDEEDQFDVIRAENIRITRKTDTLIELTLNHFSKCIKIKSTLDHPYMVMNIDEDSGVCEYSFVRASELSTDDLLVGIEAEPGGYVDCAVRISEIRVIKLDESIPVYDLTVPKYHNFLIEGDIFVHNCGGWSLKQLIQEGLGGVPGKITSGPAKHLSTLCNQMVNFLGVMQNEWAG